MLRSVIRLLVVLLLAFVAPQAWAYSPAPPKTSVTLSSNGDYRVTIIPKSWGQDVKRREDMERALARVERREGGKWRLVWEKHLVNLLMPVDQLLTNDGSLVTFDNWGVTGPDEVDIYARDGSLVRRLATKEFLPAAYLRHLPGHFPLIDWGGKHRLVQGDKVVELQIVEPGRKQSDDPSKRQYWPLGVRLTDGVIVSQGGPARDRAMDRLAKLEAERQAKWEDFRRMRTSPLRVPASRDTKDWMSYRTELGVRIFGDGSMSYLGLVLRTPEAEWGDEPDTIRTWFKEWRNDKEHHKNFVLVSPTSDRLADTVVASLNKRKAGSMKGLHMVFVGTAVEGQQVAQAAARAGAQLTLVDVAKPYPGSKLPPATPPDWFV